MKEKGIDISYHQRKVNFKSVKKQGIKFVILREGFRQKMDTRFLEYAKSCKEAGLPILGVYHFSYALNETQAKEEAKTCIKNVQKAGLGKDTIIFFDFEYDTVKKAKLNGVTLTPSDCRKHTLAFCKHVEKNGYRAGIYLNNDYRKNWYENASWLSNYEIWLADYTGGPDVDCMLQQYSSSGKVSGISGKVDMNYKFREAEKIQNEVKKMYDRNKVVDLAKSWIGKNEKDGSHKSIIDIYNKQKKLPRDYKVKYTDAWCATMASALAIALGYTEIIPVECSCKNLIDEAKKMGCWIENDAHIPEVGEEVLYDWDDSGKGDNTGWPDHVGIVEKVDKKNKEFTVIEGNYKDKVGRRMMKIDGKFIRGFICPKYDDVSDKSEVEENPKVEKKIAKESPKLHSDSYDSMYSTTADLNLRHGPGTANKAMCVIPKGKAVKCGGRYSVNNGTKWLYVRVTIKGVVYKGFCSLKYLKKHTVHTK